MHLFYTLGVASMLVGLSMGKPMQPTRLAKRQGDGQNQGGSSSNQKHDGPSGSDYSQDSIPAKARRQQNQAGSSPDNSRDTIPVGPTISPTAKPRRWASGSYGDYDVPAGSESTNDYGVPGASQPVGEGGSTSESPPAVGPGGSTSGSGPAAGSGGSTGSPLTPITITLSDTWMTFGTTGPLDLYNSILATCNEAGSCETYAPQSSPELVQNGKEFTQWIGLTASTTYSPSDIWPNLRSAITNIVSTVAVLTNTSYEGLTDYGGPPVVGTQYVEQWTFPQTMSITASDPNGSGQTIAEYDFEGSSPVTEGGFCGGLSALQGALASAVGSAGGLSLAAANCA